LISCNGTTGGDVLNANILRIEPAMTRDIHSAALSFSGMFFLLALTLSDKPVLADESDPGKGEHPPPASLDQEVQSLKQEVLALNRELFLLEEELLFPSSTQLAVFLSLDVGEFFALDSVQLKVDDKVVSNYLYTPREVQALHRGGVQRLYMGNIKSGEHELVAIFTGKGPNGRDYRRGANRVITKNLGPSFVELKIVDLESKEQPDFEIKEWK
jgi:hypothetical protein